MKIVFVTTLSSLASTVSGRVLPLAQEFAATHEVHVLHAGKAPASPPTNYTFHCIGQEPFTRSSSGKKRQHGIRLVSQLLLTSLRISIHLLRLHPDVVIIVKPFPHNVLGVSLWRPFASRTAKIILDADDFELTANVLTSLAQRATIHWAERRAARLAQVIVVATPFLQDRYTHLVSQFKVAPPVVLIPTGSTPVSFTSTQISPPMLVYLGSLSESSGHRVDLLPDILKKVHEQVPSAQLLIAGDGDNRHNLEQAFAHSTLNKSVHWQGRFHVEEIPSLLSKASIILDPIDASITQRAKSSFRTMVAATHGIPIVTSDIGIRPMLVPRSLHERFFATPSDPADYANKIINLLQTSLTDAEKQLMITHSQSYHWSQLAAEYLSLFATP